MNLPLSLVGNFGRNQITRIILKDKRVNEYKNLPFGALGASYS